MSSFLVGISFLIFVLSTTLGVHLIRKIFSSAEYAMLPVLFMLMFDGVFVACFYIVASELVESEKMFKLGISASFVLGTMVRVLYLAYMAQKEDQFSLK